MQHLDPASTPLHPAFKTERLASQHPLSQHPLSPPPSGDDRSDSPAGQSLISAHGTSMERGAPEYSQSGLPSHFPTSYADSQAEALPADHASAAPYATQQEVRSAASYTTAAATPTSEYGPAYPHSARSANFPELSRGYMPATSHSGSSASMAHTPTNPSIAQPSPQYGHQYAYAAPASSDMAAYQHPGSSQMYPQARPDWGAGYGQQQVTPQHHVFPQAVSQRPGHQQQVYSFVPIPGAQQHKRPRRRYEEIERMYKCGWNGCEKAYGTLNHLNAHVTMQSHGTKRTPEEFKEIRKEWKAKKKEEEAARKAEEDRARTQAASQNAGSDMQASADGAHPPTTYPPNSRNVTLPPIAYQTFPSSAAPADSLQQPMSQYNSGSVYTANYSPGPSPYGPNHPNHQMYNQHNGGSGGH